MDESRYKKWVDGSGYFGLIDMMLISNVQGLGLIDNDLIDKYPRLKINSKLKRDRLNKLRHAILSELWVMGTYELVRLVEELAHRRQDLFNEDTIKEITKVKRKFEEVRVPLVKYKKSGRSQPLYSGVPWFTFHPTKGYGLKLHLTIKDKKTKKDKIETKVIYRLTLSNTILNLFKKMKEDINANKLNARN